MDTSEIEKPKHTLLLLYDELSLIQISNMLHYSKRITPFQPVKKKSGLSPIYFKHLEKRKK